MSAMIIKQLLSQCEKQDIHLRVDNGKLIYRCPLGAMHPDFREHLRENKPALIRYLSKPRLVVHNKQADVHKRRKLRAFRAQVDGKSLVFINMNHIDDVRALMERKFGAERVGSIVPIGVPGSREAS